MASPRPNPPTDDPIDEIKTIDDLRRIAADVQQENRPRLVSIAGGGTVTLAPARKKRRKLTPEEKARADEEAFLSAAGSWKGLLDPEEFKRRIREGRSSNRPYVELKPPDE